MEPNLPFSDVPNADSMQLSNLNVAESSSSYSDEDAEVSEESTLHDLVLPGTQNISNGYSGLKLPPILPESENHGDDGSAAPIKSPVMEPKLDSFVVWQAGLPKPAKPFPPAPGFRPKDCKSWLVPRAAPNVHGIDLVFQGPTNKGIKSKEMGPLTSPAPLVNEPLSYEYGELLLKRQRKVVAVGGAMDWKDVIRQIRAYGDDEVVLRQKFNEYKRILEFRRKYVRILRTIPPMQRKFKMIETFSGEGMNKLYSAMALDHVVRELDYLKRVNGYQNRIDMLERMKTDMEDLWNF